MVVERIDVSGKWWPVAAPAILGAVCAVAGINLWNALLAPPAGMEEGTLAGDGARLLLGAFLLLNIGALLAQLMPFPAHVRNRVLKTAVPTVVIGSILQLGILCCMFLYLICWVGTSALICARMGCSPINGNGQVNSSSSDTGSAKALPPPVISAAAAIAVPSVRTLLLGFLSFMSSSSRVSIFVVWVCRNHR